MAQEGSAVSQEKMQQSTLEHMEIRWHGRGGQGAKTAAYLFAESALEGGLYVQAFPEYGAERSGAPVTAYIRLSATPIRGHYPIRHAEAVVVLDESLIGVVNICENIAREALVVVNTESSPAELRTRLDADGIHVMTVPATRIALETMKVNIPNTPMLGALARALGILDLDTVRRNIRKKFAHRLRPEVIEANIVALDRAYQEVKGE